MKNLLALNISASSNTNSIKWFLVSTLLSQKHGALSKEVILSSVYVQLKHISDILFSLWLSPTGMLSCKRHSCLLFKC